MALLSAEQIRAAQDFRYEDVPCPEWGGDVRIKSMTIRERNELDSERSMLQKLGQEVGAEVLVWYCAVDESGQRLFTDRADLEVLASKNSAPITRLFRVALRLNALSQAAQEELEKN